MKRLLLVGCSDRKVPATEPVRALELYDGPLFRVIRKTMREGWFPESVEVYVLSAKYGLISADTPIAWYDERLTVRRITELGPSVETALDKLLHSEQFCESFISVGRNYLALIGGTAAFTRRGIPTSVAAGGIGQRCYQLKTWLRNSYAKECPTRD